MLRFQNAEIRLAQTEKEVNESNELLSSSSRSFLLVEEQIANVQRQQQQQTQQQNGRFSRHNHARRPSVDNDDISTLLLQDTATPI